MFPHGVNMQRHTNERPYACTVCVRVFRQKTHVEQHMRIHDNMFPYVCTECARPFNQVRCDL